MPFSFMGYNEIDNKATLLKLSFFSCNNECFECGLDIGDRHAFGRARQKVDRNRVRFTLSLAY